MNFVHQKVKLTGYLPISYQLRNLSNYELAEEVRYPQRGGAVKLHSFFSFRTETNRRRAALTLEINLDVIQQPGCDGIADSLKCLQ
jgi:hypothetical protein